MLYFLIFDVVAVLASLLFVGYYCKLTFLHPATWLFFYHISSNTMRFIAVFGGAAPLFYKFSGIKGSSNMELMRALLCTDLSLRVASVFIVLGEKSIFKFEKKRTQIFPNNTVLQVILLVTIPVGIYGAVTQLFIPGSSYSSTIDLSTASSYATLTQSWFGLSMLILLFFKGLKKQYIIPLIIYLFIIAIQGYSRYRLVLPLIFLTAIYLTENRLKWPPVRVIIMGLILGVLFYPLKAIGTSLQQGGSFSNIFLMVQNSFKEVSEGNNEDQTFLDQFAITLSEIDRSGKIYYGTTLLPVLVSPIPRSIWPEKPRLNQWQQDISTSFRPFSEIGSVGTIYGESYANFRYFGIAFIPALLFYFLTKWYNRIKLISIKSIDFFFYLLIMSCLNQVMRDGVISLFVFPVINNMPLFLVYFAHKLFIKPSPVFYK